MRGGTSAATASSLPPLVLLLGHMILYQSQSALGGTCWTAMIRNGRCTELLSEDSTRDECCAFGMTTAWSGEHLDSGDLFFWRVLGGGVHCTPCKESCAGVQCGSEKACSMKSGRPRCVCAPKCAQAKRWRQNKLLTTPTGGDDSTNAAQRTTRQGQLVCGTDGRTYRNQCRLKKRACRQRNSNLAVAYYGSCQTATCRNIGCTAGKHCLLDQNLRPHCVRCTRSCANNANVRRRRVCGSDGVTYPSVCHLREAACHQGHAIPLAYRGPCKPKATCAQINCRERQSCLRDLRVESGEVSADRPRARCVTCPTRCPAPMVATKYAKKSASRVKKKATSATMMARNATTTLSSSLAYVGNGVVCGSNNNTYHSWCHMMQDACARGTVIETQYMGECAVDNSLLDTSF